MILLLLFIVGCDNSTQSEVISYTNFYIYQGFSGQTKCHEWNNSPNSSFFEDPQYSLLSEGNCIEYCTEHLNNIESGWSLYSCYDCTQTLPILYKVNSDGVYIDSTLSNDLLSAYCQLSMP